MIIQCLNKDQYDLLSMQLCSLPMGDLKIDIDEELIPAEIAAEFERLGKIEEINNG
jgi:hypothetical protein